MEMLPCEQAKRFDGKVSSFIRARSIPHNPCQHRNGLLPLSLMEFRPMLLRYPVNRPEKPFPRQFEEKMIQDFKQVGQPSIQQRPLKSTECSPSSGMFTLPFDVPVRAKNRFGQVGPGRDENQ